MMQAERYDRGGKLVRKGSGSVFRKEGKRMRCYREDEDSMQRDGEEGDDKAGWTSWSVAKPTLQNENGLSVEFSRILPR